MPESGPAADRPTRPSSRRIAAPGARSPLPGLAGRRLAVLLATTLLLLGATFVGITVQDHRAAIKDGWDAAQRAAIDAAEHAAQSVATARLVTDRVAEGIRRDGIGLIRDTSGAELAALLRHAPQIGALWIMDPAGRVVASSLGAEARSADIAGRAPEVPLQAGPEVAPGAELVPLHSGPDGQAAGFGFDSEVRGPDGAVLATVLAATRAEAFQRLERGSGLGSTGRVGLFRAADGVPLMVFPPPADPASGARPPAALPAALQAAATRGARDGRVEATQPDGRRLLVAWRLAGEGSAMLATATLPREDALAPFRSRLLRNTALFGLAAAVIAGLGLAAAAAMMRGAAIRRAAEAGQRELSAVLEATGEGVVVLDADWRIRFVNTRAAEALAAEGDLTGRAFAAALPDLVGGPVWAACERAMRGEGTATAEAALPSIARHLRSESHPRAGGGIVMFLRDVTEERAAAARLAESEARLRRVLDNLFVFVGVLAPDGTLLEANRAPLEAAGLTLADVQGQPFWECYWWSHDAATQARLRAACARAAAGQPSRYDVEVRMAGESRMTIDFQIAPLRDAGGRVTHLIPSATDVTARRRAEAALAESEARLRLAQEGAEVGVFEFDFRTRQAYWTTAMFRLYGLDPMGRGPLVQEAEFAALLHPEDREVQRARRELAWSDPEQTRFRFEFRICRPDTEELRWIASRGEVVRDESGQPRLLRGVNYDITERRRAEERQLLLAREVDHRAKNALAVVQAIVGLTRHDDPAQFRAAVTGRIAAMARAHTLLAREGWDRAELRALIGEELAPHRDGLEDAADRIALSGPSVALASGAAQPLAMALHELATNATKHGALSAAAGRVAVIWVRGTTGGLVLRWTERGGPLLAGPPARSGFGSSVVRNTVERQLGGEVAFDWQAEGLEVTLSLPPEQLRWPGAAVLRDRRAEDTERDA